MENIFKKVLFTGVGLVTSATERLQRTVDELVERGKMSEDEGKKVVEDVVKNTEAAKGEYENWFRKIVESTVEKMGLSKNEANTKFEKRLKRLEVKVGLLAKEVEAQKKRAKSTDEQKKK
ncbi:MAG: hypothetical protein MK212_13360 [Saprospiraceae bacterium]|nr:hypothetical protein [Saprospiraceae bacterium]